MPRQLRVLDQITHRNPCLESWDAMPGDNWVRCCDKCGQNVYNLSALTRSEAERLLREKGEKLCTTFFRRPDGTLLTQQCPSSIRRAWGAVAAGLGALGLALPASAHPGGSCPTSRASIVEKTSEGVTASLDIVVTDPSGAIIPGALVTLGNSRVQIQCPTSDAGRFMQQEIGAGLYSLRVECEGFRSYTRPELELFAGRAYGIAVILEVGSVGGEVYVPGPMNSPPLRPVRSMWRWISQLWT